MKAPLLLAICLSTALQADDSRLTALIEQADAADARHDSRAALAALSQADAIEPCDFGVLLRISKQYTDLSAQAKDANGRKQFAEKALDYGRRAVALDPASAKAHLNLAICYGKLTDFVSTKTKVEYARIVRDEAQRAIALDPSDDYAWHVLGRWHKEVANLNAVLKAVASFAYGGLPPASSEDAARCLKKAAQLAPQRILHRAELAKVYRTLAHDDYAAQEWQNVLGLRATDSQDEQYQREARAAWEEVRVQRRGATRGMARQ